jgi:hypothetical protein
MTLLTMWLMYTAFGVTFFSLVFVWAVRTRQFAGQDRARRLPLEYPTPAAPGSGGGRGARALLVPGLLLLLAAGVLGWTAWFVATR